MAQSEDERMMWLSEAHAIVSRWEERGGAPILSVYHAALLADSIATALQSAYDRGKAAAKD
ncbi:MAG TPA: hypothetical protein VGQ62_06275 [Chloroflexota bacterium]|jgi:hypothetical protein|nr:hypothetical protein [Chloroflexota bacterium]